MPMAGFYLLHSLRRAGEAEDLEIRFLTREEELLDDGHLLHVLLAWRPDVICCTLYLWNIERTIRLLRLVRIAHPSALIVAGGPEVSFHHPFLFRSLVPDVAVVGEGEGPFPHIIRALRSGRRSDFSGVAWKEGRRYTWGRKAHPSPALQQCMPPPEDPGWVPDPHGIAYMETGRGCPMSCTYCRYAHLRRSMSFLSPDEVTGRIRALIRQGAREIRLVDPAFNANPFFGRILRSLVGLNKTAHLRFFAEMRAETLTPAQIGLLADAGISEIEVGVQSRDPKVLRWIRRPAGMGRLEENLIRMILEGSEVTLDLMYGLPGQQSEEVAGSLQWARDLGPKSVQCLQTLLIPGTELRRDRGRWSIRADSLPPYGVRSTSSLSWEEIRGIEQLIHETSPSDCMTSGFVGIRLPDLFGERVVIHVDRGFSGSVPGSSSRRAVLFRGDPLLASGSVIRRIMREAVSAEPHMLWQFVLNPGEEFPLDLLEHMIDEIRSFPLHWIDRFASVAAWNRIASRRIFVLLRGDCRYPKRWVRAAESLLEDHFF